jgi:carboxymethylenebutenolidase
MGQFVQLTAADGTEIPAWVAQPDGPVRGALVVAQEIFGVNAHIRNVTDRMAARGFLAIAPALFTRLEADVQLGYDAESMGRGKALKAAAEALPDEGVLQDVRAAAQWAQQRVGGQKVGMVGFCWGGLLTWRAANLVDELGAAVCYYGGGMAFSALHPEVQVHVYEADHGFNCDQRASFDQISAIQAKDRTLTFFDQHLG